MNQTMKEFCKEVRKTLKEVYPEFKFSVRKDREDSIHVDIMEGPLDFGVGHHQVNEFHVEKFWADHPEAKKMLVAIRDLVKRDNHTVVHDQDYGAVPNYYIHISIGKFDNHYKLINQN